MLSVLKKGLTKTKNCLNILTKGIGDPPFDSISLEQKYNLPALKG